MAKEHVQKSTQMVNDDISPSLMVLLSKSQTIMKLIGFHLHLPPPVKLVARQIVLVVDAATLL